jgi:hypothetical protein
VSGYPTLGFDPVASQEAASDEIADELRAAVRRLGEIDDVLNGTGAQRWEGRTAEAFRASVDEELRPRISEAYHSFSAASRAFDRWAAELPSFRRRADALEAEAAQAAQRVSQVSRDLGGITEPGADADRATRDRYSEDLRQARSALSSAQGELADIVRRAEALRAEVVARAEEVAGTFDTAVRAAPDEPGIFGRIGEVVSEIADKLAQGFDWVMDNLAPILQKLARVVGAVATILAIVAFVVGFVFPPAFALAGTLGTIAKVASFVDLGIQGLRVLHGEDGALQGFALQGTGMLLGLGAARAIGPVAMNATTNIKQGLFIPQLAMVNVGSHGGAAVAAKAIAINPDFFHSLLYWGVTSYRDLEGSGRTIHEETR